jgi:hypothetical protein
MTMPLVSENDKIPVHDPPDYKPAIVEVKWIDAMADTGWKPVGRYTEGRLNPSYTTGYLLQDDENDIRVVQTVNPLDAMATEGMIIPKGMVLSITVLKTYEQLPPSEDDDEGQAASEGREHRS